MRQVSEALPRTRLIPQDFRHLREDSQSPDIHEIQEADKIRTKQ